MKPCSPTTTAAWSSNRRVPASCRRRSQADRTATTSGRSRSPTRRAISGCARNAGALGADGGGGAYRIEGISRHLRPAEPRSRRLPGPTPRTAPVARSWRPTTIRASCATRGTPGTSNCATRARSQARAASRSRRRAVRPARAHDLARDVRSVLPRQCQLPHRQGCVAGTRLPGRRGRRPDDRWPTSATFWKSASARRGGGAVLRPQVHEPGLAR